MPPIPRLRSLLPAAAAAALALVAAAPAHADAPDPFPITESFSHPTLGPGWVKTGSAALTAATGGPDSDGDGWMRLTPVANDSFGVVYDDVAFPSDRGVLAEFDYDAWGGSGADGLVFFLYDGATTTFREGARGGSLGYMGCVNQSKPGLAGAYIGVAFDEYGNFANTDLSTGGCRNANGGSGSGLQGDRVVVRGNEAGGYQYLTSATTSTSLDTPNVGQRPAPRRLKVSIVDRKLSVFITDPSGTVQTVTSGYPLPANAPATLKMGFVAATGGATNNHEIRNTKVVLPADVRTTVVDVTPSGDKGTRGVHTWQATVENTSANPVAGASVKATAPAGGLSDVTWTCTGCSGATSGSGLPDTSTDVGANSSAVYTITGRVADDADTAQLRVAASQPAAGSKTGDPDPTNDGATARTVLTPIEAPAYGGPTFTLSSTGTATATSTGGPFFGDGLVASLQWQRCDPDGSTCTDITGAVGSSYAPTAADQGSTLRLRVVQSNSAGSTTGDSPPFPLPQTTIGSGPAGRSSSSSATFTASSDGPTGTTLQCSLDGAAWAACPPSGTFDGLSDGPHELRVRASYGGLVDATPDGYAWTVDTAPPESTLDGGPDEGAATSATSAAFAIGGVDATTDVDRLECSLDGDPFAPCSGPVTLSGLADGEHTFAVRATDAVGNVDQTPATRTWRVDTTPPTIAVTDHPPVVTRATDATVAVTGDDADGSGVRYYECRIDGGEWRTCKPSTTVTDLADGEHSVAYRSVDRADERSEPVVTTWTVDTRISASLGEPADGARLRSARPDVTTRVDEGAVQVLLVDGTPVDERRAAADGDTIAVGPLADGEHSITLRASDAAGNEAEEVHHVVVDTTAPAQPVVTDGPSGPTGADVRFTLEGEPGGSLECRLDDAAAWTPCDGGVALHGLDDGAHVLHVRQLDAAGNPSEVRDVAFVVDTTTHLSVDGLPSGPVAHAPQQLVLHGEPGATAVLVVDGIEVGHGTFGADGVLTLALGALGTGTHALEVTSTDAAGNVAHSSASVVVDADAPAAPAPVGAAPTTVQAGAPVTFAVAVEDGATLECSLDGATWSPCTSPVTVPAQASGEHVLRVRQRDAVGNVSAVRELRWTVASRSAAPQPPTTTTDQTPAPTTTTAPAPAVPAAGAAPAAAASVPAQCVSRRAITIHWSLPRGVRAARARLLLDGRVRRLAPGTRSARIDMASRPRQVVRVQVQVRTADGRLLGTSRSYRTCTPHEASPPLRTLRLTPVR